MSGKIIGLTGVQVASAYLPQSLLDSISDKMESITVVLTIFVRSNLFTLEEDRSDGLIAQVGSLVVSMAIPNVKFQGLEDPVIVTVRITREVWT